MWQAGLLCLLAAAQAVVVHQPSTFGSHETNKLQPQSTFHTAINPQPQRAYTTYNPAQNIYNPAQNTYNAAQNTYNGPQNTYNPAQNTNNPAQNTYKPAQNTYNPAQNTYNPAQNTYTQPQLLLSPAQPLNNHLQQKPAQMDEYYDEPSYSFNYEIHDDSTGDEKSHTETRQGDVVQGSYSLIEPDGSRRIVDYIADKVGGFRAQVRREPGAAKPIVSSAKATGYQPINPVVQNYIPQYNQPQKYHNGPVTFLPANYNPVQPAPVTEQSKYASVAVKPPLAYNPVVYAPSSKTEDKSRTAPSALTSSNQIPNNPVQYA